MILVPEKLEDVPKAVTDWKCPIHAFNKPLEGPSYCGVREKTGTLKECEGCPSRQARAIREKGSQETILQDREPHGTRFLGVKPLG